MMGMFIVKGTDDMGMYFNPPQLIKSAGRKLINSTRYIELTAQLEPGENLFGLFDRGVFFQAPYLYSEAEFLEFSKQIPETISHWEFYAVTDGQAVLGVANFKSKSQVHGL